MLPLPSPTGEIIMYSIDRHVLYEHLLSVATRFTNVKIEYDVKVNDI